MKFAEALEALESGALVRNAGWNHEGSYVAQQNPDENSKMTVPYLYFNKPCENTPGGWMRVPWVASQFDILRGDWEVLVGGVEQSKAA